MKEKHMFLGTVYTLPKYVYEVDTREIIRHGEDAGAEQVDSWYGASLRRTTEKLNGMPSLTSATILRRTVESVLSDFRGMVKFGYPKDTVRSTLLTLQKEAD